MISDRAAPAGPPAAPAEAFVWVWLPEAVDPVVAGRITREGSVHVFNYGRSYLDRTDAIAIYDPELRLGQGAIVPEPPLEIAGCLRDGAPDAWGRRVIINQLTGLGGAAAHDVDLDELTFMLHSSSDRIGALDFQRSPEIYAPREQEQATLAQLQAAADHVERGEPIPASLEKALFHGSSIGGARPKALIEDGDRKYIAKFSATNDTYAVVRAEFVAMQLAKLVGLDVAPVELTAANGKDVLLVERFDRGRTEAGWTRKAMVSALTMLELSELQAHYAGYADLAQLVRKRFDAPRAALRELFGRMVFNILTGNTDDHARNHAALWNGSSLSLTPAYDICPQARNGRESNQAIAVLGTDRRSLLENCRLSAASFLLSDADARKVINEQAKAILAGWPGICDRAGLSVIDRTFLWRRQFLNDYVFEGYADGPPAGL